MCTVVRANDPLTHCELARQLAVVVSGVQRHVLFWSQDQHAVLEKAQSGSKRENCHGNAYVKYWFRLFLYYYDIIEDIFLGYVFFRRLSNTICTKIQNCEILSIVAINYLHSVTRMLM